MTPPPTRARSPQALRLTAGSSSDSLRASPRPYAPLEAGQLLRTALRTRWTCSRRWGGGGEYQARDDIGAMLDDAKSSQKQSAKKKKTTKAGATKSTSPIKNVVMLRKPAAASGPTGEFPRVTNNCRILLSVKQNKYRVIPTPGSVYEKGFSFARRDQKELWEEVVAFCERSVSK